MAERLRPRIAALTLGMRKRRAEYVPPFDIDEPNRWLTLAAAAYRTIVALVLGGIGYGLWISLK